MLTPVAMRVCGLTLGLTPQLKTVVNHENSAYKKKTAAFLQLSDFHWWEHADLNRRPPACRAGALNQLSYAPGIKNHPVLDGLCRGS